LDFIVYLGVNFGHASGTPCSVSGVVGWLPEVGLGVLVDVRAVQQFRLRLPGIFPMLLLWQQGIFHRRRQLVGQHHVMSAEPGPLEAVGQVEVLVHPPKPGLLDFLIHPEFGP